MTMYFVKWKKQIFLVLGILFSTIGILNLPNDTYWGEIIAVGGLLIGSGCFGRYIIVLKGK